MSKWKKVKIGDLLLRSKIPIDIEDTEEYKRVTIRIKHQGVSLRDIEIGKKIGTKKQFILKSGQFLMSKIDARYGAFGIAGDVVDNAIITGNFWAYDINSSLTTVDWINKYTNSPAFYDLCERASSGVTHRRYLNEQTFLNHELYIPSIDEQSKILFSNRERTLLLNNLENELNKQEKYVSQLKQAILQEAIAGQLTAEWRTENPMQKGNPDTDAAALLAKIKAEKQRLIADGKLKKEKTLAEIAIDEIPCHLPNGWMWCRIDSLVFSLRHDLRTGPFGSSLHKHDHKLEGIPVLGIESIDRNGKFTGKNKIFVDSEKGEELATFSVKGGDIILSRSGTVGEICRIPDEFEYGLISTNLMKISLDKRVVLADFFCLLFKGSKTIEKQLFTLCVGSTRLFLTQTILSKLLFPLPPLAEQKAIVEKVDKLMNVIDRLEQQIKHRKQLAENLMQTVLREAFE